MHWLYYLAIVLFAGVFIGKVVSYLKLPKVTGYLLAGIIISPNFFNLVPEDAISPLTIISEAALAFIAYSIGSSLNFKSLKKIGKGVMIIALLEALMAVFVVALAMIFIFNQPVAFSIAIGSIAAATAPAATLMVLKQYEAKGPLVDTLIPVVAIDDAIAVIAFGISLAISKGIVSGDSITFMVLAKPFFEIILSFLLGIALGYALIFIVSKSRGEEQQLTLIIATLFLAIGLSEYFHLSSLLVAIAIGTTISNLSLNSKKMFSMVDKITAPIFIAFFTISGLELDLSILKNVGIIGCGYVVFRVIGKVLGSYLGAKITNSPSLVQKYLGLTLVPQAGVAIGLSLVVQNELPSYGATIRTIILAATVIYELIGPLCTKIAIYRAGEARECRERDLVPKA